MRHILLVVSTVICIVLLYFCSPVYAQQNAVEVDVVEATQGNISQRVTASGTVIASNSVKVTAPQSLKLLRSEIVVGQEVKEGEVLFVAEAYDTDISNYFTKEVKAAFQALQEQDAKIAEAFSDFFKEAIPASGTLSGKQLVIRSPINGCVTEIFSKAGDDVAAGISCAEISDLQNLSVKLEIPEGKAEKIKEGMICSITGEAFSKTYTGVIRMLSPVAQTIGTLTGNETTIVDGQVDIRKPAGLRPGYSTRVTIFTEVHEDAVLIPYDALIEDEDGKDAVFVLKEGKIEKKSVTTGLEQGEMVEIRSGVVPGEQIICSPEEALKEGQKGRERTT